MPRSESTGFAADTVVWARVLVLRFRTARGGGRDSARRVGPEPCLRVSRVGQACRDVEGVGDVVEQCRHFVARGGDPKEQHEQHEEGDRGEPLAGGGDVPWQVGLEATPPVQPGYWK